jgi:hypothetical protein
MSANATTTTAKPTVFIHTNAQQMLGAKVSAYSLKKASKEPDAFDVSIIALEDYPHLTQHDGQTFLREGKEIKYQLAELQSFTLLRFLPPQLMNYQGRAVVIDPDIFAVGDVNELLQRDMNGHAVMCRRMKNGKIWATSSMLMDCARLTHWQWEHDVDELFAHRRDYADWIGLGLEPEGSVGLLENKWNDFDHLDADTKLLHNTRRTTQPWKTGLPYADLHRETKPQKSGPLASLRGLFHKRSDVHQEHPDKKQQELFFGLIKSMLTDGALTRDELQQQIEEKYLRPDALQLLGV